MWFKGLGTAREACAAEDGARDDGDEEHDVYLEAATAPGTRSKDIISVVNLGVDHLRSMCMPHASAAMM